MAKLFFFEILNLSFALTILLVNAQNQLDFISIDCGASKEYTDEITGIHYTSDSSYIGTGESKTISSQFSTENISQQYQNVRSFPEGKRNCYKLTPSTGKDNKYLIRASFMYGNYDGLKLPPEFDLYVGVNKWKTVKLEDTTTVKTMEIIHLLGSDYIHVCLVRKGNFTPFISALEMRLMDNDTYVTQSGSLETFVRFDCGSIGGQTVRFREDVMDRIWTPFDFRAWRVTSTSLPVQPNSYEPPSLVMSTAVTPKNSSSSIIFRFITQGMDEEIPEFYLYMHFSEVDELRNNETREFDIYLNNTLWFGALSPPYLRTATIYSSRGIKGSNLEVVISRTENSTLPPLLNAFEVYSVKHFPLSEADKNDVDAITNVKSTYKITRNWQGDPCEPLDYRWEGLSCSYNNGSDPPRITSLNLSSSELTGEIDPHIHNLTFLEKLDLSNNNLSGNVPDFLSQMSSLKFLYLDGNNFSGTLPQALKEKSRNGSIFLSANGNSHLCLTTPCKKEDTGNNSRKKIIIIVSASVGGFLLLVLTAGTIFWCLIRRTKQSDRTVVSLDSLSNHRGEGLNLKKQQISYSEVLSITTNFERILGKGGFGTVYHGYLGNSQVAVKMLSRISAQGFEQFNAEAKILTRVYHKNLTAIIGFCDEGPNMGLVYEYMSNGDLASHLSGKNEKPLGWKRRLKIAIDAALGLEYLHSGCKPPIIHRDVKSTNILLNEKMQAKLSDFGLSRAFPLEDVTHVSTIVVGTPGYVDPLYFATNRLTEKSDVFSFGVVLLEIITGRPAISSKNGEVHVVEWVNIKLAESGDVKDISDPRLEGDFNKNSVWKAVEVAMACVDHDSTKRPVMTQVIIDLKLCLEMEMATDNSSDVIGSTELVEMVSVNPESGLFAR